LKGFLTLYPEFATQMIYIGGEDYAGKFVPNIAASMWDNGFD
jgi:carboxypeptidase C (cathepsin A)